MNNSSRTPWVWLIIALVLMLGGSMLAAWVNGGGGAVAIKEIKIFGTNGYVISAYLYTPASASAQKPAPGILMFHGLNNQKDYMTNSALEFARRGYVVLNADMTGHGYSTGANGENAYGGPDALRYLRGLATVDKANIGLVGMSQGGFGPVTAAAQAIPDGYTSIFYMESECNAPGNPNLTPCKGLKNVAYNIGTATELGIMVLVNRGLDAPNSPVVQAVFGVSETVQTGKLYGSIEAGTARMLYQPWEEHAGSTDAPVAIGNAIQWMQMTLKGGANIPPGDQVWGWKFLGTAAALFGAFLSLFALGALWLRTPWFASLAEATPVYKGFSGAGWWIAALITTALGPLTYLWAWQTIGTGGGPLPPNALWPQNFTNVYMVWSVAVGLIAIVLIWVNHRFFTQKQGATAVNYGVTWESKGLDWGQIGRSLLLAVCILLPLYVLLLFINSIWLVDFRAWVVSLMPMSPVRFQAFLGYLLPFALYYVPQGIIFAAFLRWNQGRASLAMEMLVNAIVLTLGALVWVLVAYIPLFAGSAMILPGGAAAGLGAIYYLPLIVLWPLVACLYTWYFRKTGRVYTGIFLVTLFMVWLLAAFGDFGITP